MTNTAAVKNWIQFHVFSIVLSNFHLRDIVFSTFNHRTFHLLGFYCYHCTFEFLTIVVSPSYEACAPIDNVTSSPKQLSDNAMLTSWPKSINIIISLRYKNKCLYSTLLQSFKFSTSESELCTISKLKLITLQDN
jgi:hypothetical protein